MSKKKSQFVPELVFLELSQPLHGFVFLERSKLVPEIVPLELAKPRFVEGPRHPLSMHEANFIKTELSPRP